MMYHPIKFGRKKIFISVGTVKTVMYTWLYEPSLWPWTWRQTMNLKTANQSFFAWQSGPWWRITIPSLFTEGSAVEKIPSIWTSLEFLTFLATLTMTRTKAIQSFSQDNPVYDDVPSNKVLLQKDQKFRRYIRKSHFDYIILYYDPDLEVSKPIFLEDNLAHDDAST